MRATSITITLEGNTWQDVLVEMDIIQEAARAPQHGTDIKNKRKMFILLATNY